MKRSTTVLLVGILLQSTLGLSAEPKTPAAKAGGQSRRGYACLFIGHSFFIPVAKSFEKLPGRHAIRGHTQRMVFSGGASGSPGSLWKGRRKSAIQAILKTGKVEMLGMTYYNSSNSSAEDYGRWIDFALKYNPDTRFFIGLPWGKNGSTRDLKEYSAANTRAHLSIHKTILTLRKRYPKTMILCANYGRASYELKGLFEAGNLPGITSLRGRGASSIYRDSLGHANDILKDLSALVWLAILYDVDLTKHDWTPNHKSDIKKIAIRIAADEAPHNREYAKGVRFKGIRRDAPPRN